MKKIALSFLSLMCAAWTACGAPPATPPDAGGGVNGLSTCFDGDWDAVATWDGPSGLAPAPWGTLHVVTAEDGSSLTVAGICPDGSGTVSLRGVGTNAGGPVDVACKVPMENAPPLTLALNQAFALSFMSDSLIIQARGSYVDGSGQAGAATVTLRGFLLGSSKESHCH